MNNIEHQNKPPALKILIVDDADSMRALVTEYLRRNPDIAIGEAGDSDEALSQVKEFSPDVVLMDISLGRISGVDVTRQIKSSFPNIRVYLFSAYNKDDYRNLKSESLCDGFIQKTCMKSELQQMIQTELELKKTSRIIEG